MMNFQLLFESAPGLYLILDPRLHIVAVTDNYLRATKTARNAILGRHIFDVFPDNPDDMAANATANLRASLDRVLHLGQADTMAVQKYDIPRPESEGGGFEERHWSPVNFPVKNAGGELMFILHRVEDVTDFIKLKQERSMQMKDNEDLRHRLDQTDKMRQSQKMEAIGQLAGGVAHDFNNMLAAIILNCDKLLDPKSNSNSKTVHKGIEQIVNIAQRAARLTRQLLAFSRKQILQPTPILLNTVVASLEDMLNRLIRADIELKTILAADLGHCLLDSSQLEQVILNLVMNARDAISGNGKITVETANVTLDHLTSSGAVKVAPGEYVMLSVTDTGVGMDAATKARIFEPFFSTKGPGAGTGLGLATVYGIVSQNKGTLWVYSELGKGSVFKIFFPRAASAETIKREKPISQNVRGTETVLVVEDQLELREIVILTLEEYGYKVIPAVHGADALRIVNEKKIKFDILVTDVVMPEMGGRQLVAELNKMKIHPKTLFLSGYAEDNLTDHGQIVKGPIHFLEKPFTRDALLMKVRELLNG